MDIAEVVALHQLHHKALLTMTHCHSECCVWSGLHFDCWHLYVHYCLFNYLLQGDWVAVDIRHEQSFMVECRNTWNSANPPSLADLQGALPMGTLLWDYSTVYINTTCRVCTWRCRSHQFNNNVWRTLGRIQKCSTHFYSTITFFKCVCSLSKSNNSHYI